MRLDDFLLDCQSRLEVSSVVACLGLDGAMLTWKSTSAGIYGFLFHRDGEWIPVIVDDNIYLTKGDWDELPREDRESAMMIDLRAYNNTSMEESYRQLCQTGSRSLYFGACVDQNETWLPLLEKAFAKAHGDYSALSWGNPGYYSTEK